MTDVVETPPSVTTEPTMPVGQLTAARSEQLERELGKLKAKSRPDLERVLVIVGVLAAAAGFAVAIVGITGVRSAGDPLEQGDSLALTILGIGTAIVGAVVWARHSLSRYLRYWLVRDLYERHASTDRIVEAIEGQSGD